MCLRVYMAERCLGVVNWCQDSSPHSPCAKTLQSWITALEKKVKAPFESGSVLNSPLAKTVPLGNQWAHYLLSFSLPRCSQSPCETVDSNGET